MRIVVDTNVLISGIFFGGAPYRIVLAWRDDELDVVVSPEIVDEYWGTAQRIAQRFPGVDVTPILVLLISKATIVVAPALPLPVCEDRADDKFLACAVAGRARRVISGDRHLLKVSGYRGISVQRPREFADKYLGDRPA